MSGEMSLQCPTNFLGLTGDLAFADRARAWVLPVPYAGTVSYGKGTEKGPQAIIDASQQVEWYDHEFGSECAAGYGIHTLAAMPTEGAPEDVVQSVAERVAGILAADSSPELLVLLGGEHSISGGVARALAGNDLVAVQIDAHADLRDRYEDTPTSHACTARRIAEACPVYQVGIRNISEEGERFRRESGSVTTVFSERANEGTGDFLAELAGFVHGKRVYLTIDLDGLDPSIMPAVGTPEPGGLSWERTIDVLKTVAREAASIPVADVVELAPIEGMIAPDFLAAKLVYKLMSFVLMKK